MKLYQNSTLIKKVALLFLIAIIVSVSVSVVFYLATKQSLKDKQITQYENTLNNMRQNTEDIASSVVLMSETLSNVPYTQAFLENDSFHGRNQAKQQLNRLILRLINNTPHIVNILLQDDEGTLYSFSSFDYLLASKLNLEYGVFSLEAEYEGFSGALYLADEDTTYFTYRQSIYNAYSNVKNGSWFIICSTDSLDSICDHAYTYHDGFFAILDADGQILSSNEQRQAASVLLDQAEASTQLTLYKQVDIPSAWSVLCSVPRYKVLVELNTIHFLALLLIATLLLSFLLLAVHINRGIVSPLVKIVAFLKKEPSYIMDHRLAVCGDKEIEILADNINQMLSEVKNLNNTILQNQAHMYELQLSAVQGSLKALRSQINPHFLNNTLLCIQGLAFEKRFLEISDTVTALSNLMNYNLNSDNTSTVDQEFSCIKVYLQIMSIRTSNRFTFHLEMEEGVGCYRMPRFLLQPIVENALLHGLIPSEKNGSLTLRAMLSDHSTLRFECIDDGVGIPQSKLAALKEKLKENPIPVQKTSDASASGKDLDGRTKIGVMNVHSRIQLIYGLSYGLTINSDSSGTSVCMEFPVNIPNTSAVALDTLLKGISPQELDKE